MKKEKLIKLKVRKTNRFTYLKHRQASDSASDTTVTLTTTLTGYPNWLRAPERELFLNLLVYGSSLHTCKNPSPDQ